MDEELSSSLCNLCIDRIDNEAEPHDLTRKPSRNVVVTTAFASEVFDIEIVPSAVASITPILRIANEVESEHPHGAYLCRFYVFEKADGLDPSSTGGGVLQFKTALLQTLERSERKPSEDPLVLWLSGGPSYSSFFGLITKLDYSSDLVWKKESQFFIISRTENMNKFKEHVDFHELLQQVFVS